MPSLPHAIARTPVRPILVSRFGHRVVGLFLALGLVLATIAIQVYRAVGEFVEATESVVHTLEVEQGIAGTVALLRDIEASQRAYMISANAERLADYYANLPRIDDNLARLKELVADNPRQQSDAGELEATISQRLAGAAEVLSRYREGGLAAARASQPLQRSRDEDLRIDAIARHMLARENALLAGREAQTATMATLTRVLTIGAILLSIGMLALALAIVLREQRRRLCSEAQVKSSNVELADSLAASQRLGRTLRELSELGEMLQGCRSLAEAVSGLKLSLPRLLPATSGSLNLINASQNLVETVIGWGDASGDGLFAPDDCWALRRGQTYPPADTESAFTCRHLHAHGDAPHLCVPLLAHGEMLGILTMVGEQAIGEEMRAIAIAVGEQVSLALANLQLQETLRTQSLRDPLTGLFNRRYLEASLERELQRANRRGQALSVLMLDIDHFKRFNDSHGHDAGDALLAQFGAMLARTVRSEDVACRYGGEEFTVILHETDAEQARVRAEEIRAATRALEMRHRRQTLGPITVSIGIATSPRDGTAPGELLRSADRALYAAKHGGRDQVRLAA